MMNWLLCLLMVAGSCTAQQGLDFHVDPYWPKTLPEDFIFGQVGGLAVDCHDRIWVIHRPRGLLPDEACPVNEAKPFACFEKTEPAVLVFDQAGNLLHTWKGPGEGYEWPEQEHGIYVDPQDNVWIGGNAATDNMVLKFNSAGKFLMQIGHRGLSDGSNSKTQLGRPAGTTLDLAAKEIYIADGYGNRRIVVFDSETGVYKRHWGAYGGVPSDDKTPAYDPKAPPSKQFGNPVHAVKISKDGLVYVADRNNNRIQIFQKDGRFVKEFFLHRETTKPWGAVWDLVFSNDPEQRYLYVADGMNGHIYVVSREDGKLLRTIGRTGHYAGEFMWVHCLAIDSKGNIYTGEVSNGRRVQKFVPGPGSFKLCE